MWGVALLVAVVVVVALSRRGGGARIVASAEEIPIALKLPISTMQVGPYRLIDLLSESQSAMIYSAQSGDGTLCTVKLPSRACLEDATEVKRFEREAEMLDKVAHANVIRKLDAGTLKDGDRQVPYLVLEHLGGRDLGAVLSERAPFPPHEALALLKQIANALDAVHSQGIVHRNMTPDAIRLYEDGRVVLHNFGVARSNMVETITVHGQIVGTIEYIAPEQMRGEKVDARADLYALGVLAYRMLTGKSPFKYANVASLIRQKTEQAGAHPRAVNEAVPEDLDRIVSQLMAADPAQRPAAASVIASELAGVKS
jgi:serine/threonine-protein kinase